MTQQTSGLNININSRGAKAGAREVNRALDKVKRKSKQTTTAMSVGFKKAARSMFSMKGVVGGLTAAFIALAAVSVAAKFEQEMAVVSGVMRATQEEFIALNNIAREMGETTEWSATQSASALKFLGMAGFEAEKAIAALPGTLDLATAGNLDLGRAADIATNALTAMGLGVDQLGRINDVFVGTITRTNTDMNMMAESFKYAAPAARAFGYDTERLSAMIGMLGNAGIQGSMAGTQLSFAFTKVGKVFDKLGMDGSGKDLVDALAATKEAGWGAEQMLKTFGQRGGKAALILRELIPELVELEDKLDNSAGEAQELADIMRDTLIGDWKIFKSTLESVGIDMVNQNMGVLRSTIENFTEALRAAKPLLVETAGLIADVANWLSTSIQDQNALDVFIQGSLEASNNKAFSWWKFIKADLKERRAMLEEAGGIGYTSRSPGKSTDQLLDEELDRQAALDNREKKDAAAGAKAETDIYNAAIKERISLQNRLAEAVEDTYSIDAGKAEDALFKVWAKQKKVWDVSDWEEYGERMKEAMDDSFGDAGHYLDSFDVEAKETLSLWADLDEALQGVKGSLGDFAKEGEGVFGKIKDATSNALDTMEDQVVNFVTNSKFSFSDLANSIVNDLARIAVQRSITSPLASGLSDALSGLAGAAASPSASPTAFNGAVVSAKVHGGSKSFPQGATRSVVDSSVFAGAPRLHSGLAPDEFPAILQRGERVIPRSKAAESAVPFDVEINIINSTGGEVSQSQSPVRFNGQKMVCTLLLDAVDRNAYGTRDGLKAAIGRG